MTPVSPLQDEPGPPPEEDEPFGPDEGFASVHDAPDVDGHVDPESGWCGEDERSDEVEVLGRLDMRGLLSLQNFLKPG